MISKPERIFRTTTFRVQSSTPADRTLCPRNSYSLLTSVSPEEYLYTMLNAADTGDKWNAYSPQLQAEIDAFVLPRPAKYSKESTEPITNISILRIAKVFTVSLLLPG
ncbi:hypothetical protein FVER53590_03136 [Fusarium verticillioides]|nr:hypothetical protein FVER14953_03136 [Fusarium verticillioides]RBQ94206.1 hypothetical protein FVER53263_03136 [Fusarium verticillioides]RBR14893.1 hypothetical protein FVER53590_03136 [Fusarium verticillioides]